MRQIFDIKENCDFLYNIGSHKMRFETNTKKLSIKISEQKGEIFIEYDLMQAHQIFTSNSLQIEYSFIVKE